MTKKGIFKDLWIVILDIIAVNLAYYLALLIRFFVNGQFRQTVSYYLTDFYHFAPFYTVICLVVFFLFRLYGGMWMYAGLNDMNRIIGASLVTAVLHVIGTMLFIRRMPITYYLIGAILQFVFVVMIRFSYRLLLVEKKKLQKSDRIPALVVGSGDLGRKVVKHLEDGGAYRVAVIAGNESGRTMDGVPVVSLAEMPAAIRDKKVQAVFIADRDLSDAQRKEISAAAEGLEQQDFTGALSNMTGAVPVTGLLETVSGPVTLVIDGETTSYSQGSEALSALHARYFVREIAGNDLRIELTQDDGLAYLRQHQEETGEELSFF